MIRDKIRQYGYADFLRRMLRFVVRPIWRSDMFICFIVPNYTGTTFTDSRILNLTSAAIDALSNDGKLSKEEDIELRALLSDGSYGIGCMVDGDLAGHAWIQPGGTEYRFGNGGYITIPNNFAVMKNLYVRPSCRGDGLGRVLNQARLALVSSDQVPVVFIINDNRIAIRNWGIYGFKPVLEVSLTCYLSRFMSMKVRQIADLDAACVLARNLRVGMASK